MTALARIARRMCRIYFLGLSVRPKEAETDYVTREWRKFVPMAAAAAQEMAAIVGEIGKERLDG